MSPSSSLQIDSLDAADAQESPEPKEFSLKITTVKI